MRKHPSTRRLGERLRVRVLHRPPRAARPRRRLLAVVVPLDLLEQHPVLGAAAAVSVAHAVVAGARVVRHDGGHAAAAPLLLDRELLADEVVAGLRLAHLDVNFQARRAGREDAEADDRRRPAPGEVHVALGHVEDHDAVRVHARRQRHVQDELRLEDLARTCDAHGDAVQEPLAGPLERTEVDAYCKIRVGAVLGARRARVLHDPVVLEVGGPRQGGRAQP